MVTKGDPGRALARHTRDVPCPICGGHDGRKRGRGERCHGFISSDGLYAHCTREEHAGGLKLLDNSGTYAHKLMGECRCGVTHLAGTVPVPQAIPRNGHGARIVATYPYEVFEGDLLYELVRYEPKRFCYRRPDGRGGWLYNLQGVELVLYRLPKLLATDPSEPVVIVEGEKDVDRLISLGILATTAPMGAGKWRDSYTAALRGREVIISGDNDAAGVRHVEAVATALHGQADALWILELDGLPEGGDVSDWLDAGHTAEELRERMVNARPWEPESPQAEELPYIAVRMCDVERRQVQWLWPGRIPRGKLTIVVGDAGEGKSWAMLDLAARLSTGTPLPGETERPDRMTTVLLAGEDNPNDTIGPRLDAQRGDDTRIVHLRGVLHEGQAMLVRLQRDLKKVERALRDFQAGMLVIDPLGSYLDKTDGINDVEVRNVLMPLADLAERTGVAIVAIMHRNKGMHGNPLHSVVGSVAFGAVARSVLAVAPDRAAPGRRVLLPIKGNVAAQQDGVGYSIHDGVLTWDCEPVTLTAETIFAPPGPAQQDVDPASQLGEAAEILSTILIAHGGRAPTQVVKDQTRDAGVAWRTVERARSKLGAKAVQVWEHGRTVWYLELPCRGSD